MDKLLYKSRYYDARPFRDLVLLKLQFNEYVEEISFPVQVERKRMPILTYARNDFLENFYFLLFLGIFVVGKITKLDSSNLKELRSWVRMQLERY